MRREFQVIRCNLDGLAKAERIAKAFDTLLTTIEQECDAAQGAGGRELAIVRTKLEEACFFAKKAMASIPGNQEKL